MLSSSNGASLTINLDIEEPFYYTYFIKLNEKEEIIGFWSTGPNRGEEPKEENWIIYNDKGQNYQFTLNLEGAQIENPSLCTENGVYLYKFDYFIGSAIKKTEKEIEQEEQILLSNQKAQVTLAERVEATEAALLELILGGD